MKRASSNKIGGAIASARPSIMHSREVYTGAELAPSSARPGAYDAGRLPSLIHGHRVSREQQRADLHAPLPAACPVTPRPPTRVTVPEGAQAAPIVCAPPPPPPAPLPAGAYTPQPGSVPGRVLAHLHKHGGVLTYADIEARFGLAKNNIAPTFRKPLNTGLLERHRVLRAGVAHWGLALRGVPLEPGGTALRDPDAKRATALAADADFVARAGAFAPTAGNAATVLSALAQMRTLMAQAASIQQLMTESLQHLQRALSPSRGQ